MDRDLEIFFLASEYSKENAEELVRIFMETDSEISDDIISLLNHEVLPLARKAGHYGVVESIESALSLSQL